MKDPNQWRAALESWVLSHRKRFPLPDGHMLDPLQSWQRRVTGGLMLQFFEYATAKETSDRHKVLQKDPLSERVFVCVTDMVGAVAFHELVDRHSDKALWLFKEEWQGFLAQKEQDHDELFEAHYEFWSVWHRQVDPNWELPTDEPLHQVWVHEEGFVLADKLGRGAQNLWDWDGTQLRLVQQGVTRWVSESEDLGEA